MAKARKSKAEKELDNLVERLFYKHGSNIEFNIMDLGRLSDYAKAAIVAGGDPDEAMKAAVEKFRIKAAAV
jgi:hypothetical protein